MAKITAKGKAFSPMLGVNYSDNTEVKNIKTKIK